MAFKTIFSKEAIEDIKDIMDITSNPAYRKQFRKELNQKMKQLEKYPESAPLVYKNVRVAVFLKAPFKILYTLTQPIVYIIGIWHQRRGEQWKDRL
ncbi:MAG: type II toxin-antitoxin system RelE/ParE family toxin [Bacteroidota bacterium]